MSEVTERRLCWQFEDPFRLSGYPTEINSLSVSVASDNRVSLAEFCEAVMTALLVDFGNILAAFLWICFIGPWIARSCGIPVPSEFWTKDWQNQHLTRLQFVWAFGVLVFGIGMFLFSLDSDIIRRVLLEKSWSAKLFDLGFELVLSIFMTIVIAFCCAQTQAGESPVIELGLSRRQ